MVMVMMMMVIVEYAGAWGRHDYGFWTEGGAGRS